jgi:hypothetical protein
VLGRLGRGPLIRSRRRRLRTRCDFYVVLVCYGFGDGILREKRKGGIRINPRAKSSFPLLAVPASAVGDVEGHYYSISLLEERNSGAGFDYDSHVFVA